MTDNRFYSFLWCSIVFWLMYFRQVQQIFISLSWHVMFILSLDAFKFSLFSLIFSKLIILCFWVIFICVYPDWWLLTSFIWSFIVCVKFGKKYLLISSTFFSPFRGLSYPYMREIYTFHISLRLCWFKDCLVICTLFSICFSLDKYLKMLG